MKKDIKHIVLVDAAHIFRTFWHASEHKPLGSAFRDTVDKIHGIAANQKYDAIICCIDAPPYLRAKSFPNYKANRPETAPEMHEQYRDVQDKLKESGYHIWKSQGHEADDIIASATKVAVQMNIAVDIYTGDKDLLQLVSDEDRVQVISTRTGDAINEAAVLEKLKVRPSRVGDYLALMGDKSDGIPGCPGVAEVRAAALTNTYDSWAVLMSDCKEGRVIGLKSDSKLVHNLRENVGVMQNARALVTLVDDIPLTQWSELYEEKTMDEAPDEEMMNDSYTAPGFDDHPDDIEEPVDDTFNETTAAEVMGLTKKQGIVSQAMTQVKAVEMAEEQKHYAGIDVPKDMVVSKAEVAKQPRAAIAPAQPAAASIELRPGVSVDANQFKLIEAMANRFNKSGLYRRKFDSVDALFTVMLLGVELGLSPQLALQNMHMVEGRPTMAAHLMISLAVRHPDCEYMVMTEETPTSCTYETKSRSYPKTRTFTYTLADARQDGVRWAKEGSKNQRSMLRKTAGSHAARNWYPQAIAGMYSTEEFGFDSEVSDAQ